MTGQLKVRVFKVRLSQTWVECLRCQIDSFGFIWYVYVIYTIYITVARVMPSQTQTNQGKLLFAIDIQNIQNKIYQSHILIL